MALKDRTSDFLRLVATSNPKQVSTTLSAPQYTKFWTEATQLSKSLADTSKRLAELSKLAKSRALFNDDTLKIEKLTFYIKNEINNLNKQIVSLKEYTNNSNSQTIKNSELIITSLNNRLATITSDFHQVLKTRTENIRHQQKSKMELSGNSFLSYPTIEQNYEDEGQRESGDLVINMPVIQSQESYSRSRLEDVQVIETMLKELEDMFRKISVMVATQGELIQRIDSDVDGASDNLSSAQNELLQFWSKISSSRGLYVKVFIILIVFFTLFLVLFL